MGGWRDTPSADNDEQSNLTSTNAKLWIPSFTLLALMSLLQGLDAGQKKADFALKYEI